MLGPLRKVMEAPVPGGSDRRGPLANLSVLLVIRGRLGGGPAPLLWLGCATRGGGGGGKGWVGGWGGDSLLLSLVPTRIIQGATALGA